MPAADRPAVLVAPLDWGLGHAARCMPLIDRLLQRGHRVHLAGNGASFDLLTDRYPELPAHELPGYDIRYPVGKNASVQILMQSPRMFRTIKLEQVRTEQLVAQHRIGVILSDNRYGAWSRQTRNILMCHQVAIRSPRGFGWTSPLFRTAHFRMMRPFHELWIPDLPGADNLSGELSHGFRIPVPHRYIGPLSRFAGAQAPEVPTGAESFRIVALLSGNEPQRTHFENLLAEQLQELREPVLIVRGVTQEKNRYRSGNLEYVSYLQADKLLPVLQAAAVVICRSGYSTLMDLSALGKKALLIPTPGQTEQEYLADELARKGLAAAMRQDRLDISGGIANALQCRGLPQLKENDMLLEAALGSLA